MISPRWKPLAAVLVLTGFLAGASESPAQDGGRPRGQAKTANTSEKAGRRTASIHWQRVPLRDAMGRLRELFDESVFVDRRLDPGTRITLDIEAATAEQAVAALANENGWSSTRVGTLVYLGPAGAANELRTLIATRTQDLGRMSAETRKPLASKQSARWERLAEPRSIVATETEKRGWHLANDKIVPHDLWSAGELPELTLAEQLSLLLIGFDQTFAFRPADHAIEIVAVPDAIRRQGAQATARRPAAPPKSAKSSKGTRQVYTLRVQEKPVGAVLKEFAKRLNWEVQIDEDAIRKAGKSLDKRVSFSVENADRDQLLEALLIPAGLEYQIDGEQVRIVPAR